MKHFPYPVELGGDDPNITRSGDAASVAFSYIGKGPKPPSYNVQTPFFE
jgi:hypothetical protein